MVAESPTRSRPSIPGHDGRTRAGARRRRHPVPWLYLVPAVVLLVLLAGWPLVQLVRMAFSDVGPTNILGHWSLVGVRNFTDQLTSSTFWQATLRTAQFTLVLLVADLVIGFLAACALSSTGRSTNFVLGLMVLVWALPPLVSGSVWKFLLTSDGAINSVLNSVGIGSVDWLASPSLAMWSVSMVAAWASIPFATLIIRGGMLAVPRDVIEAAAIDGAGYWRTQRSVVLPSIRATLGILTILVVLYAFRGFDFVYVMTSGGPGSASTTLPFLAYQNAFTDFSWSSGASVAVLSMVVVLGLAVPYVSGVRKEEQA